MLLLQCRTRSRQRDIGGDQALLRLAHVPLAHPVAAGPLREIEMDMGLVIAVGTRPEHGREAPASARPHAVTKILGDRRIGQADAAAVGELYAAHIERVGAPMLAELGTGDVVAPTAIVGRIIVERARRRSQGAR